MLASKTRQLQGMAAADAWVSVGPTGTFTRRNGRIAGIQVRAVPGSYLVYAGAANGGVWRAQGAPGWTSLGDNLPKQTVRAFAVHPNNPDDIIVGTGDYGRGNGVGAGMWRTTNGGGSWNAVALPGATPPQYFYRIIYHPDDANILIAASSAGILRSTDGGANWSIRYAGHATGLVFDPTIPNIQYACVMGVGVIKSFNGGDTWVVANAVTSPFGRASIAICPGFQRDLAVVVESGGIFQGVFKTADGGANWDNISGNLSQFGDTQIDHAQAIAFRPDQPSEIYVGAVQVAKTTDAGANWTVDPFDYGHADVTQLYFSEVTGPDVLWICNDGGIYKHNLGGATDDWNGDGVTGLRCSEIDFLDAKRDLRTIALQDNGVVRSLNAGASWEYVQGGDGWGGTITDPLAPEFWFTDGVYGAAPARRVYRKRQNDAPIFTNNTAEDLYEYSYSKFEAKMFSGTGNTLISAPAFSGNPTWSMEFTLPTTAVHLVYGDPLDGRALYVTDDGAAQPNVTACRKNGATWTTTLRNLGGNGFVRYVHVSKDNFGEAWAGLFRPPTAAANASKIFHTVDFGQTWQNISGGVLQGPGMVQTIVTKPLNSREIYAGTDVGVFRSLDGGTTWTPFQEGLPIVKCTDIRYISDPNRSGVDKLVVATYGRGVYQRDILTNPVTYVDENARGFQDGTFDYPLQLLSFGLAGTGPAGILALRANLYLLSSGNNGPVSLDKPMTITSYGGTTNINLSSGGAPAH